MCPLAFKQEDTVKCCHRTPTHTPYTHTHTPYTHTGSSTNGHENHPYACVHAHRRGCHSAHFVDRNPVHERKLKHVFFFYVNLPTCTSVCFSFGFYLIFSNTFIFQRKRKKKKLEHINISNKKKQKKPRM